MTCAEGEKIEHFGLAHSVLNIQAPLRERGSPFRRRRHVMLNVELYLLLIRRSKHGRSQHGDDAFCGAGVGAQFASVSAAESQAAAVAVIAAPSHVVATLSSLPLQINQTLLVVIHFLQVPDSGNKQFEAIIDGRSDSRKNGPGISGSEWQQEMERAECQCQTEI